LFTVQTIAHVGLVQEKTIAHVVLVQEKVNKIETIQDPNSRIARRFGMIN
jgi:hypothetical protein